MASTAGLIQEYPQAVVFRVAEPHSFHAQRGRADAHLAFLQGGSNHTRGGLDPYRLFTVSTLALQLCLAAQVEPASGSLPILIRYTAGNFGAKR